MKQTTIFYASQNKTVFEADSLEELKAKIIDFYQDDDEHFVGIDDMWSETTTTYSANDIKAMDLEIKIQHSKEDIDNYNYEQDLVIKEYHQNLL